ncbi:putative vesicle-mediated transport [Lyophyllum shimeji]|uniref:Vesicle-mediated transport n=1 Tax=Lyophyllum shimeji TaxID=47721 RepID=A0A9P3PLS1_LYOSH|nr:putative vesicle-mediated transport [Lyophyllum shimeji]
MASLLERMNIPTTGPVRHKSNQRSSPYNRSHRIPKGDVDSPWTHDLYDNGSLSARLDVKPAAPKLGLNNVAQKALREATAAATNTQLSIKGASAVSSLGNVLEVAGLATGTTAEDVAAIFKRCGEITAARLAKGGEEPRIRLTFKQASSAAAAVAKFNNQPADGKVLDVRIIGATSAGTTLSGRLGGTDGLGLVREEGSVDVFMDSPDTGSKMRSDSLLHADPRAQVLVAPPGANPADYIQGYYRPPAHCLSPAIHLCLFVFGIPPPALLLTCVPLITKRKEAFVAGVAKPSAFRQDLNIRVSPIGQCGRGDPSVLFRLHGVDQHPQPPSNTVPQRSLRVTSGLSITRMGAGWLFLFAVFWAAGLMFGMIYFIIMFSDLESDYVNPIDLCNKLNQLVIPETAAHAFLAVLFLLSGQWMAFALNAPLVAYNAHKIINKNHMYDATEIFRTLDSHKKESFFKIAFYLLSFFYYLYRMIAALVAESE